MDPFYGRPLKSLTLADIQRRIDNGVSEDHFLDYKQDLGVKTKGEKKEFLRDITAFANADGGLIVFGIDEERDEKGRPTGIPKSIDGFDMPNQDAEILALDSIMKDGVDERLPTCEVHHIEIGDAKILLMIRIRSSMRAPHMVTLDGDRRFYIRAQRGVQEMSTGQIRDAVMKTESIERRVRDFINNRIKVIDDLVGPHPYYILHIIPVFPQSSLDLTSQKITDRLLEVGSPRHTDNTHCLEGFKAYQFVNNRYFGHGLTFRDGTVEFLDAFIQQSASEPLALTAVLKDLIRFLKNALQLYKEGYIQPPYVISLVFGKISTSKLYSRGRTYSFQGDGWKIVCDPFIGDDPDAKPENLLKRPMDIVWNAFGQTRCFDYNADGFYIGDRYPR